MLCLLGSVLLLSCQPWARHRPQKASYIKSFKVDMYRGGGGGGGGLKRHLCKGSWFEKDNLLQCQSHSISYDSHSQIVAYLLQSSKSLNR